MFRITPLIRNLIIVNVVVFLLQSLVPLVDALMPLYPQSTPYYRPYQLFTYMLAHGGFSHIFFNMLALASFGPILESYWGEKRFLLFYLATGICGGLVYAIVSHYLFPTEAMMVGASGAIYGILMAFGISFPNMEITLLFPPIPIRAKYLVVILGVITYATDRSGQVAHAAHFGGAIVGYILISNFSNLDKRK